MPDFHGSIQHVTIAGTLWLVLAFPALAALFCAWRALSLRPSDAPARDRSADASIAALGLALVVSGYLAWALARRPADERFFLEHLWRMARVGQLDASFDLALDPLSSTMTVLVTGLGFPIVVRAADRASANGDAAASARFFAWLNGFVTALLLVVLADNFVLLLVGWVGLALASWGLAVQTGPTAQTTAQRAFLLARIGDAGLLLGVAVLYWGFGGAWTEGDYVPDLNARFASVEVGPGVAREPIPDPAAEEGEEPAPKLPPTTGEGFLTLTSYSGAVVFMDDTRAPLRLESGAILRAPFARFPVKGGLHSFRVHPGGGLDDFLVTHVAFGGEREIALASFGPSVTFRNLRDQLAAEDGHARAPVREALVAKRLWARCTVLVGACLLFFVGALGKGLQLPLEAWSLRATDGAARAPLVHATALALAGVYLVARVWFLVALSGPLATLLAALGAFAVFLAAAGLVALAPYAGTFLEELDRRVVDGLVNGAGVATTALAWIVGRSDDAIVDGAVRLVSAGTHRVGGKLQRLHSGRLQTYLLLILLGVVALAFLPYWLR